MKRILTAAIFSMILMSSFIGALAVPPGVGTVVTIDDVQFPTTVYMGKEYYIHGVANDVSGNPIEHYSCSVMMYYESGGVKTYVDRESIKYWCKENLTQLPADDLADGCYYTTWRNGHISIPVFIDPMIYESGKTYSFALSCGTITEIKTAAVVGVSNEKENGAYPFSCNVDAVKINDGTDSTTDYFDENPNKLDKLNISFSLDTLNTVCTNEEVRYKVNRDVNGSWVGQSDYKTLLTDVNGKGVISLPIDGSYFVGGTYQLVVMADDKQDDVNFTVATMRPMMEGYETADWANENMSGLIMWMVLIMALAFAFLLLRAVMR
jgi:hypothetical protein